jgi:hypothetical protein
VAQNFNKTGFPLKSLRLTTFSPSNIFKEKGGAFFSTRDFTTPNESQAERIRGDAGD